MYRMEQEWLRKQIPSFYCYYFLKFAYANSYARMHELFTAEIENMGREKDSYAAIKKTIEAREVCLTSLRREVMSVTQLEVQESLKLIAEELRARNRKAVNMQNNSNMKAAGPSGMEQSKSWKNKLEQVFQALSHLRKLTCFVVELIKNWKATIYSISADPRRFRERVIFFHNQANYLLKAVFDCDFLKGTFLAKYLSFADHYDPFVLKSVMILESKRQRTEVEEVMYHLITPTEVEMGKIIKALVSLAEEEYDQDQQSRFIAERQSNSPSKQDNRKQPATTRLSEMTSINQRPKVESEYSKTNSQQKQRGSLLSERGAKVLASSVYQTSSKSSTHIGNLMSKMSQPNNQIKEAEFADNKMSDLTKLELAEADPKRLNRSATVKDTLTRVRNVRSIDLKKVSPYLARNSQIEKAQQALELEHKFRVAQEDYLNSVKAKKQMPLSQRVKHQMVASEKEITNSRIFNKYIEQNLKMMDEANRKAYLYKNDHSVSGRAKHNMRSEQKYAMVAHADRKEAEYQLGLEKYYKKEAIPQQSPNKRRQERTAISMLSAQQSHPSTKAIIEISERGVRATEQIVKYELTGQKGKNVATILENQKQTGQKAFTTDRLSAPKPNRETKAEPTGMNLYENHRAQQIVILRQEPEKLQEIKQFLYTKIRQELLEEMKKNAEQKELNLDNMLEEEKRKQLNQILEQRRIEDEKKRQETERRRIQQLELERKKIGTFIRVEPVTFSEENLESHYNQVFDAIPDAFRRLFCLNDTNEKRRVVDEELYCVFLKGYHEDRQMSYSLHHFDWTKSGISGMLGADSGKGQNYAYGVRQTTDIRKLVIDYLAVNEHYYLVSSFHNILSYIWKHDPASHIELTVYIHTNVIEEDPQSPYSKICEDLLEYAARNGDIFERQLFSNVVEKRLVFVRPSLNVGSSSVAEISVESKSSYPFPCHSFGKSIYLKAELLSCAHSLAERVPPAIDLSMDTQSHYVFLLEELFRSYLTPEEVVQLRQNSVNIRRLKDIFKAILELDKGKPVVEELTVVEGLSLQDLYERIRGKTCQPYERLYWPQFYDKTLPNHNRLVSASLQLNLNFQFSIHSAILADRRWMKINPNRKILTLKSSIYPKEDVYILPTSNPKIKMFLIQGEYYKLMRMELFIFLNLLFNNIVADTEKYVTSFWVPQFCVSNNPVDSYPNEPYPGKTIKRITDFSINMKRTFLLGEEMYFCCHEYIKNAVSYVPKGSDVMFREAMIVGFLHTAVEKSSTGMPIYGRLIDRKEHFPYIKSD